MSKQGNAVIASDVVTERFHYLDVGVKRLVIEMELLGLHDLPRPPLGQIPSTAGAASPDLQSAAAGGQGRSMLAGDFNAFWGEDELELFLNATGLRKRQPPRTADLSRAHLRVSSSISSSTVAHVDVHQIARASGALFRSPADAVRLHRPYRRLMWTCDTHRARCTAPGRTGGYLTRAATV
jgi:hypothetical protein